MHPKLITKVMFNIDIDKKSLSPFQKERERRNAKIRKEFDQLILTCNRTTAYEKLARKHKLAYKTIVYIINPQK